MLVVTQFAFGDVPVDLFDFWSENFLVVCEQVKLAILEAYDLAVIQVNDVRGSAYNCGHVARKEVFVLSDSDDERGAFSSTNELVWTIGANDGDSISAVDVSKAATDAVEESSWRILGLLLIMIGNQVAEDF